MNQIDISCQHLELTDSLASHVRGKMDKVLRHLDVPPTSCSVVLSTDRNVHKSEIKMHAHQHDFFAKSEENDMYVAIDSAIGKIDRQIKEFKHKNNSHRS